MGTLHFDSRSPSPNPSHAPAAVRFTIDAHPVLPAGLDIASALDAWGRESYQSLWGVVGEPHVHAVTDALSAGRTPDVQPFAGLSKSRMCIQLFAGELRIDVSHNYGATQSQYDQLNRAVRDLHDAGIRTLRQLLRASGAAVTEVDRS